MLVAEPLMYKVDMQDESESVLSIIDTSIIHS